MSINLMQGALTAVILQPRKLPNDKLLAAAAMSACTPGLMGMVLPMLLVGNGGAAGTSTSTGSGTAVVTVPDVRNQKVEDALATLTAVGLSGDVAAPTDGSGKTPDIVLEQMPAGGVRVQDGSSVWLTVVGAASSSGKSQRVPDVVGDHETLAHQRLSAVGLTGRASHVNVSGYADGVVIEQMPLGDSTIGAHREVHLRVQRAKAVSTTGSKQTS